MTRSSLFDPDIQVVFRGSGLTENPDGSVSGKVTRIDVYQRDFANPAVVIKGLNIPDIGRLFDTASGLTADDLLNLANPDALSFRDAVTPPNFVLSGSGKKDFLEAGSSPVTMNGLGGNDVFFLGVGDATINGGAGKKDVVSGELLLDGLVADLSKGTLTTADGTHTIAGVEVLYATPFADNLTGSDGKDRIFALEGDDDISGEGGSDILHGDDGNDVIAGGAQGDNLFGENGNDELLGGPGRDYLNGGYGDDRLVGGPGKDVYVGGPGADRFVFPSFADLIKDHEIGVDTIVLSKDWLTGGRIDVEADATDRVVVKQDFDHVFYVKGADISILIANLENDFIFV